MKHSVLYKMYIAFVLLTSCNSNNGKKPVESSEPRGSNIEVFEFPIEKFSLPYDTSIRCDSNSLMFLHLAPFDTSYLLHIRKGGQSIRGICYFLTQSYHRDMEDYFDKDNQLLYFEGISFKLDSSQWRTLKQKTTEAISKMPDSSRSNSTCFDCHTYVIAHDNKQRVTGNSKLSGDFKTYDIFVRDSVLNYFIGKRNLSNKNDN